MATPIEYVLQLKAKLATNPIVASFTVVEEKVWPDRGYIRIRMVLSNGDFLEAAEYFVLEDDQCVTQRYRYQWMDGERRELRKRWDNVEHYPDLPNFPHHVHIRGEENVKPGERLSIVQLVDTLAREVSMMEVLVLFPEWVRPTETGGIWQQIKGEIAREMPDLLSMTEDEKREEFDRLSNMIAEHMPYCSLEEFERAMRGKRAYSDTA